MLNGYLQGQRPLEEIVQGLPVFGVSTLKLPMSEDEARQYVEGSFPSVRQAGLQYRPTLGIRYIVKDARLDMDGDRWSLGLDVELLDYALYADRELTVSLLTLPHPPNVRVFGSEAPQPTSLPIFDNYAKRLMVTQMVPELRQSTEVITSLFRLRWREEREAFRSGTEINFSNAVPRTVVNKEELKPTAADLDGFVQWMARNAPKQGDHVLMDRVLDLGTANRTLQNFWAHGGTMVYSGGGELIALARDALPGSFGFITSDHGLDSASHIVYALSSEAGHLWRDEALLSSYSKPDQLQLEVQISKAAIRRSKDGKAVLIVELHPVALQITHQDGSKSRRELPQADQTIAQNRPDPASRFDILGIKLGMPIDEARNVLAEAYGGETRTAPPSFAVNSPNCTNILNKPDARVAVLETELIHLELSIEAIKEQQNELGPDEPITATQLRKTEAEKKEAEDNLATARIEVVRDIYDALLAADCITDETPFDASVSMADLQKMMEDRFSGTQFGILSELPKTVRLEPVVMPGLTFAFASYFYPAEDYLLVYQASADDGRSVVAGIYRTIRSGDLKKNASAFADGMLTKYGDPHFKSGASSAWLGAPDDPMVRRLFEFGDHACTVPAEWYETVVFPKGYLANDCGVVLIGDHYRASLLDTRLIRQAAEKASAATSNPADGEQVPAIRF